MTTYESVTGRRPEIDTAAEDERAALDRLAARRLRVALVLTTAMLVVYFTFILLIAFDKSLLGEMITDGLSLGILLGVIVVLSTWVLTWIYVAWANRRYEPAARELRERAQ
ncbi:MAG TPA: DUF485 domain-containing protein [Gaiellaceae bacterium]|nr:DUF485 domain-containing protein [Gaiellaceae bacterium]